MEGIFTLLLVMLVGAVVFGLVLGLFVPRHHALTAAVVAMLIFTGITVQHLRLNGRLDDITPIILYAILAAVGFLSAWLGLALGASIRNRKA